MAAQPLIQSQKVFLNDLVQSISYVDPGSYHIISCMGESASPFYEIVNPWGGEGDAFRLFHRGAGLQQVGGVVQSRQDRPERTRDVRVPY